MCSLSELPPEILIEIFLHLPVTDCLILSKTCKTMSQVSTIDLFWEKKIYHDFGIQLGIKKTPQLSISPKMFYRYVLHKYGRLLGLWQLATFGHYGGLYQFVFDNWSLKLIEWSPPSQAENVQDPMRPVEFLSLSLENYSESPRLKMKLINKDMYQDQSDEDINDIIISMSDVDKMTIFLPSIKDLSDENEDLDDYHQMLVRYINFETGKSLQTIQDFGHLGLLRELHLDLRKFNVKMNCRKILGFNRLQNISTLLNSNPKQKPITPGIFKGTYGSHGIEIIEINYPSTYQIEGVKITGDPNIPMNKVTFRADLRDAIILSKEEQKEADCESLQSIKEFCQFQYIDFDSNQDSSPLSFQPFILPRDATQRAKLDKYEQCLYRFISEAQVSPIDYSDPTFVPAHLIIFDCDTFGVLFLTLQSMSLYSRISENFGAVNYFECVENKCKS